MTFGASQPVQPLANDCPWLTFAVAVTRGSRAASGAGTSEALFAALSGGRPGVH
jgi:hypothetical protein